MFTFGWGEILLVLVVIITFCRSKRAPWFNQTNLIIYLNLLEDYLKNLKIHLNDIVEQEDFNDL